MTTPSSAQNAAAFVDSLLSDGHALVPVSGVTFHVTFQNGTYLGTASQADDAHNVIVSLLNFGTSSSAQQMLAANQGRTVTVNISNNPGGDSGSFSFLGIDFININVSQANLFEYQTTAGDWSKFTIQHIVNHELVHTLLDYIPDGDVHNAFTNSVNAETQAGPNRSYDYSATRIVPPCFAAGTPILLGDGTSIAIEDIRAGMHVAAFDARDAAGTAKLTSGLVARLIPGITREWIVLADGTRVTPHHRYLCPPADAAAPHAAATFSPIADILGISAGATRGTGLVVDAAGNVAPITGTLLRATDAASNENAGAFQMRVAGAGFVE